MQSLRAAAVDFDLPRPPSLADLLSQLEVQRPCSLRDVLRRPARYRITTELSEPYGQHATSTLSLSSDGHWQWQGEVHELGAVHQFTVVVANRYLLPQGQSLVFARSGTTTAPWTETGFDARIAQRWRDLRAAGFVATLTSEVDGNEIARAVGGPLGLAVAIAWVSQHAGRPSQENRPGSDPLNNDPDDNPNNPGHNPNRP